MSYAENPITTQESDHQIVAPLLAPRACDLDRTLNQLYGDGIQKFQAACRVAMMEPADLRNSYNLPEFWRLHGPRFR